MNKEKDDNAFSRPLADIRLDYKIILDWIESKSKVLDLGCGDGELLALLIERKGCHGTGIEINEKAIYKCVARGVSVSHGDIDTGLLDFSDKRFDYVVLNGSLQEVVNAKRVILEALRVGKKVIVGIPNFCHYKARFQVAFLGKVPVIKGLPYQWYDTPNLRFLSLTDFRVFCRENSIRILKQIGISGDRMIFIFHNLLANWGLFLLEK